MAFLAELGALTDELATIVTSTSPTSQPGRFRGYRESALRSLRNRNYLQTNQFLVEEQLRGLVERFSVVGRDGLSDALRQRLDSLSAYSTRWMPEILHLLLELSDQPVQKSKLGNLGVLRPLDEDPGPRLTWEDVANEDGWAQDRDLWKSVDFADSSEDEPFQDSQSQVSVSDHTSISSEVAQSRRTAKDLVLSDLEDAAIKEIGDTQAWRHLQPRDPAGRPLKVAVSEFQILREVLFMMNGLQSDLFGPDCTPVPRYQLSNVSWDTYRALINSFAERGRTLLPLRKFCQTKQDVHLVQAFQDSVCRCLRDFDKLIASIQARYVHIKEDTTVSLIAMQEELKPHLVPLTALGNVVRQLQEERYAHTFRFLELLYDATCIAQLSGDDTTYSYLGAIFFDCFQVYIRPIRQWMEDGELTSGDKTFFVSESSISVPLNQIWSEKFQLRRSQEGHLHAPRFLQPTARKIFNTGKSIVVLKHLGRFQRASDDPHMSITEPPLDFEAVCSPSGLTLAPFSELFSGAFDRWIQSKHRSTSSNLQTILFESCGLWSTLDALHHVYFMSDGSLAETFTSSVFASLDALNTTWTDRFILTELAQEAWSPCLEPYRLSAAVEPGRTYRDDPVTARCSVRNSLPGIRLTYKLAWPVQLIVTRESLADYQAVFTLLLQLRRAAAILVTSLPAYDTQHSRDTAQEAAYHGLRARLLWLTNTLQSYLTTLVLVPEIARMRIDLQNAEDVDAMIEVHSSFARRVLDEACLGAKLEPIRECVLDMLDLAIRLEDARRRREGELSMGGYVAALPSPTHRHQYGSHLETPKRKHGSVTDKTRGLYVSPQEKERQEDNTIVMFGNVDDDNLYEQPATRTNALERQTYSQALMGIRADFDRHLRFMAGGLRGVARASMDVAAVKWDILAEMLEMGIRDNGRQVV